MAKHALHKPTSDGYEATRKLWEDQHRKSMDLPEAVEICRRCHRMAPFCFYNGNTFTAIIRDVITGIEIEETQGIVVRSLAGHIVAGVASEDEVNAFREFCRSLEY
ncbi:MAG: hypothetical protein KF712_08310 [Akkermansiaceae bacterium]|nr:hypothetical protein [Akkermansiaceae bacterium]